MTLNSIRQVIKQSKSIKFTILVSIFIILFLLIYMFLCLLQQKRYSDLTFQNVPVQKKEEPKISIKAIATPDTQPYISLQLHPLSDVIVLSAFSIKMLLSSENKSPNLEEYIINTGASMENSSWIFPIKKVYKNPDGEGVIIEFSGYFANTNGFTLSSNTEFARLNQIMSTQVKIDKVFERETTFIDISGEKYYNYKYE